MAIEKKTERTIVLSIVNHKGGVGKTTTVINLAHALVRLGESQNKDYRVLVVDSDPQANATSVLFPKGQDITRVPTIADVYDEREPFPIAQTRCVTSKVNEAVKIKGFSVIDDIEQDTHGMGQDFGMPEIQ